MILSVTISPAFEYFGPAVDWVWIAVLAATSFVAGFIAGRCEQRG